MQRKLRREKLVPGVKIGRLDPKERPAAGAGCADRVDLGEFYVRRRLGREPWPPIGQNCGCKPLARRVVPLRAGLCKMLPRGLDHCSRRAGVAASLFLSLRRVFWPCCFACRVGSQNCLPAVFFWLC